MPQWTKIVKNVIENQINTFLVAGTTIARQLDVCCVPPSSLAARATSTTCPADEPSCVTSPPSASIVRQSAIIEQNSPCAYNSPCACINVTSASQHVPERVLQDMVHHTDSGGCAGVVRGLTSGEAYGAAGASCPTQ